MEKFTPPQAESEAKAYVDLLRSKQFDQIEKNLDPSIVNDDTHGQLVFMASLFPSQQPTSIKIVGVNSYHRADSSDLRITLEYEFPGRWLLASIVTQDQSGVRSLLGFHVDQIPDSLEHNNRLSLAGKGPEQYCIVAVFLVDMGITFYVLVLCVKTGLNGRNWFWPIVCLFGVGRFAVNWTTGKAEFTTIWIGFPPAGATANFYSPWIVYAAVPLGAILFLVFHNRPSQTATIDPIDSQLPDAPTEPPHGPPAGG